MVSAPGLAGEDVRIVGGFRAAIHPDCVLCGLLYCDCQSWLVDGVGVSVSHARVTLSVSNRLALGGRAQSAPLDRDHQLGEVAVADDPPELPLGSSMPAAVQRLRMSPSRASA